MQIKIAEKHVLSACMQYLTLKGYQVIRNNTGAIPLENNGRKRLLRFGQKGSSDILACSPTGRFVAVECKSGKGKLTPYQHDFLDRIKKAGGIAVIARSIDDLERAGL